MKIDGKFIAEEIKNKLKKQISLLRSRNIYPYLAVILIGDDPASKIYVCRKKKIGEEIGAKITNYKLQITNEMNKLQNEKTKNKLISLVTRLNHDKLVHGIIIQRPVPLDITKEELDLMVVPEKDVDGFHPKSLFDPPIAKAVEKILEWIYKSGKNTSEVLRSDSSEVKEFRKDYTKWLKEKEILIIGRGETAGQPLDKYFTKLNIPHSIAHSQTKNIKELCLSSDIIISCVGRSHIVRQDMITKKTILIGVGLHPENEKLATDYDQEEIASKAGYYTPVPGGVGPVNVACLFRNLLSAVK